MDVQWASQPASQSINRHQSDFRNCIICQRNPHAVARVERSDPYIMQKRTFSAMAPCVWNGCLLSKASSLHPPLSVTPPGLPLNIKMSSLQTLLPWPIWSFIFSTWTTPTLTATLSPPGILEIGPELLLTPFGKPPFDSSQRSWIIWCPDVLSFRVAL